jgi:hypothetical protein
MMMILNKMYALPNAEQTVSLWLPTIDMEQSPWEANSLSANQGIPPFYGSDPTLSQTN